MLKNITLSAEDKLISMGRIKANSENTTLNEKFRQWLASYANATQNSKNYHKMMDEFSYAKSGKIFTRDEMNER